MRTVAMWTVVLSMLVAVPAWAKGKAKPETNGDVVALRFGWPAGLSADVTYRWTRTKKGKPPLSSSLTARLTVAAEGDGLRVSYRGWKRDAAATAPAQGSSLSSFEKMAAIVDKKGSLVRIDGNLSPDDARRVTTASMTGTSAGPDATNKMAELIPLVTQQNAAQTWQMLVETWAGADIPIGRDVETEEDSPVPVLPGTTLKTRFKIRAARRVDCPGQTGKRCVELKLRTQPDPASLAKVVEAIGAKFGTNGLGSAGDLSAVEELTLVTEPDRLLPHQLDVTKTIGVKEGARIDKTTWTFRYPPPSK